MADLRPSARRKQSDTDSKRFFEGQGYYNISESGVRVGIRLVSPKEPDTDGRERSIINPMLIPDP